MFQFQFVIQRETQSSLRRICLHIHIPLSTISIPTMRQVIMQPNWLLHEESISLKYIIPQHKIYATRCKYCNFLLQEKKLTKAISKHFTAVHRLKLFVNKDNFNPQTPSVHLATLHFLTIQITTFTSRGTQFTWPHCKPSKVHAKIKFYHCLKKRH